MENTLDYYGYTDRTPSVWHEYLLEKLREAVEKKEGGRKMGHISG